MQNPQITFQLPNYWEMLSDTDKYTYTYLRAQIATQTKRNQRFKRVENFSETIEMIKNFCIQGNSDDWRRCLVCGICWLPEGIAINTRQLRVLIFKCKSSINGSLQRMGFTVSLGRSESSTTLTSVFPILRSNVNELRKWTIRGMTEKNIYPVIEKNVTNNTNRTENLVNYNALYTNNNNNKPFNNRVLPIPCIKQINKNTKFQIDEENSFAEETMNMINIDYPEIDNMCETMDFEEQAW